MQSRAVLDVKAVLDVIDEFFVTHMDDQRARDLWAILSALRGPDDGQWDVKGATTVYIRARAFPKAAKAGEGAFRVMGIEVADSDDPAGDFEAARSAFTYGKSSPASGHFMVHIDAANWALKGIGR